MPPRHVRYILAAALVVVATVAAACRDDETSMPPTSEATPPPAQEVTEVPDGATVVDQVSLQFVPDELVVSLGEDIYFLNSERTPHTVTINGENVSGAMGEGDVVVWTPLAPGVYRVTCDFHRYMDATITVAGD